MIDYSKLIYVQINLLESARAIIDLRKGNEQARGELSLLQPSSSGVALQDFGGEFFQSKQTGDQKSFWNEFQ